MQNSLLILLILSLWSPYTFAQTVKCFDSRGKVVYSNTDCPNNTRLDRVVDVPGASDLRYSLPPSSIGPSRYENHPQSYTSERNALSNTYERSKFQLEAEINTELARREAEDLAEQARQEAEDLAEQARQEAENATADLLNNERIRNARNNNRNYLLILLVVLGLAFYKVVKDKKNSQESQLKANEKVGVCIVLLGLVAGVFSLMISNVWAPQLDVWQNLVGVYGLSFSIMGHDIYTKHVIFGCFMLICYGVIVYLDIFKAPEQLLVFFKDSQS